jgi:hypothetical protein
MKRFCALLIVMAFISIFFCLYGQDTIPSSTINYPQSPLQSGENLILPMSRWEFSLSIVVLIFGILVILLELFLIKNRKIGSENIIKFLIVTLIIISTLFLITAGYSNDQIAPAVGLLGTIAGYLLGKSQPLKNENTGENNQ